MKKHGSCKGVFTALVIASACIYVFALYYLLFGGIGRGNIMLSREMVKSYAYNLIPLKTVIGYITAIMEGTARGSAALTPGPMPAPPRPRPESKVVMTDSPW